MKTNLYIAIFSRYHGEKQTITMLSSVDITVKTSLYIPAGDSSEKTNLYTMLSSVDRTVKTYTMLSSVDRTVKTNLYNAIFCR